MVLNVFCAVVVDEPPLQRYWVPPLAVNVTWLQSVVVPEIVAKGSELTVTVVDADVLEQPLASVTITL